ncbi:MAG TPA: diaminopimelate epimerase [Chthoniobacterales bacterium]|jgi:diaminopimelate epimerase|nr:diaminopimelate epimerase [Chthoniobacterales bacterium]
MRFSKYHGLGNDYLVIDEMGLMESPERIRVVCDRNFGIGSDGILFGPLPSKSALAGLRIFNPDGSEAEKSGNGIRIFCRHLWERGSVGGEPFLLETAGGIVRCRVRDPHHEIEVEMGIVNFWSDVIPVMGERREVLDEALEIDGESLKFSAATIGNPHCVVLGDQVDADLARRLGPKLERHSLFPNRTNVQFLKVVDQANIRIEIWERGAGYTLASGSSASAAAAVARRLGLCGPNVRVHMPGGELKITIGDDFSIVLSGPVTKVGNGTIHDEIFGTA